MMSSTATQSPPAVRFANAAQWWDSLGNVPLDRVVFDPWPGTATEADMVRLDDHEDRICELIDGTLVEKAVGTRESAIAMKIGYLLMSFVQPRKLGIVLGADGMLRLLARRVRVPDVAFITLARLPGGRFPDEPVLEAAPDLAVEVISGSNTRGEMTNKLHDYFAAGTTLVWYVDPRTRTVDVYESPERMRHLTERDSLTAPGVLPGFTLPIAEIFQVP